MEFAPAVDLEKGTRRKQAPSMSGRSLVASKVITVPALSFVAFPSA